MVDTTGEVSKFVGVDVYQDYSEVAVPFDAVMVTDVATARQSFDAAVAACGEARVLAPALLGLRPTAMIERAS
jgi:hypothetical protein